MSCSSSSSAATRLRLLLDLHLRRPFSSSPSATLNPSDPSAPLSSKQKSRAALSLLKSISSSTAASSAAAAAPDGADADGIVAICRAAALSPSSHLDRHALSLAVSSLSTSRSFDHLRSLLHSLLLSPHSPPRHLPHAIVLFGQAGLLDDALRTFRSHPDVPSLNALLSPEWFFFDLENHYLAGLFRDVEEYCDSPWHKWRAKLVRDYFSNPWAILSLIAALVVLIFTFLQTFYTIFPYYHPH